MIVFWDLFTPVFRLLPERAKVRLLCWRVDRVERQFGLEAPPREPDEPDFRWLERRTRSVAALAEARLRGEGYGR